jgi:hypothetical protein
MMIHIVVEYGDDITLTRRNQHLTLTRLEAVELGARLIALYWHHGKSIEFVDYPKADIATAGSIPGTIR